MIYYPLASTGGRRARRGKWVNMLNLSDWMARWKRRIPAVSDRLADGLLRRQYIVLFLFSVCYFLATCFRASRKLFWFDELTTVYVSRLPDMASVWGALKQGADLNPPLFYALTRLSESLFGEGHVAARLPEIVGFWILCLCLYRFVSIRTAYYYGYEARPHGIVLGLGGIALVCWQAAIGSERRAWWLGGLFAALTCAILNHAYGILLIVPLALAELVRSLLNRRIDWPVWVAMAASFSGVLPILILWRGARGGLPSISQPTLTIPANSYEYLFGPAAAVLAVGAILYFVVIYAWPDRQAAGNGEQRLESPEVVALIAFLAIPFFAYLLAKLTHAPLFQRYSISAVIGFGCVFGIAAARRKTAGLCVLLFLVLQIGENLVKYAITDTVTEPANSLATLSTRLDEFSQKYREMEALPNRDLPIVLLNIFEAMPIIHYAPAELASRLIYVAPGTQSLFQGYVNMLRITGSIPVRTDADLSGAGPRPEHVGFSGGSRYLPRVHRLQNALSVRRFHPQGRGCADRERIGRVSRGQSSGLRYFQEKPEGTGGSGIEIALLGPGWRPPL